MHTRTENIDSNISYHSLPATDSDTVMSDYQKPTELSAAQYYRDWNTLSQVSHLAKIPGNQPSSTTNVTTTIGATKLTALSTDSIRAELQHSRDKIHNYYETKLREYQTMTPQEQVGFVSIFALIYPASMAAKGFYNLYVEAKYNYKIFREQRNIKQMTDELERRSSLNSLG